MKVILQSTDDMSGQIRAAQIAMREHPGGRGLSADKIVGIGVGGKAYGVKFNKCSLSVFPQVPLPDIAEASA